MRYFNTAAFLLGGLLWAHCCLAADQFAIDLPIFGPDAKPLLNADIEIRELEADHFENRPARVVQCKTNASGIARFSWPKAIDSVIVVAHGIGYGRTGTFEIVGQVGSASLPPLAPFGSIAGTIPKEALRNDTTITLWAGHDWNIATKVQADGEFILKDVPAGNWRLEPMAGGKPLDVYSYINLLPGRHVKHVVFNHRETTPPGPDLVSRSTPANLQAKTTWVTGLVRDRAGKPIAGASVTVVSEYFGSIRAIEETHSSTTDGSGRFIIEGSTAGFGGGTVFVSKEGYTPLIDWITAGAENDAPSPEVGPSTRPNLPPATRPAPVIELTMTDHGGQLDVSILSDGKPASGVSVMLQNSNIGEVENRSLLMHSGRSDEKGLTEIFQPIRPTDAAGVAHFTHLRPGSYDIYAAAADSETLRNLPDRSFSSPAELAYGEAKGIPVASGKIDQFVLPISTKTRSIQVRALRINGTPMSKVAEHLSRIPEEYEIDRPDGARLSFPDFTVGEGGSVNFTADSSGLWHFQGTYRDSHAPKALTELPYNRAAFLIAVSPLIKTIPVVDARARRFQAGSLTVEVRDIDDKPARAAVFVDGEYSGATDQRGLITFQNISPWLHTIVIQPLSGREIEPPDPFSTDATLRGQTGYLNLQAKTGINIETKIVARPVKFGFIRGRLTPQIGHQQSEYYIGATSEIVRDPIPAALDEKTGRFVIAPIPPGKVELYVYRHSPNVLVESHKVEIEGGDVIHVDLSPGENPAETTKIVNFWGSTPAIQNLIRTASHSQKFRVLMSDRKTPAFGASLNCYAPNIIGPVAGGNLDAFGRMRLTSRSFFLLSDDETIPRGSPKGPVLVARLPGSCGATIVPIPEELPDEGMTIILPPPMFLPGHVTVSSTKPIPSSSRITVTAAREDLGKLNPELSVSMTTQANGDFALSGLTPGRYRVQADLDGLWFSPSFMIDVPSAGKLKPLTLDISPGGALLIRVVDKNGAPAIGVPLKISRPDGPLADALWPANLETDGAGNNQIPALEAGMHEITVGFSNRHQINIPPLKDDQAAQELKIVAPEINLAQ